MHCRLCLQYEVICYIWGLPALRHCCGWSSNLSSGSCAVSEPPPQAIFPVCAPVLYICETSVDLIRLDDGYCKIQVVLSGSCRSYQRLLLFVLLALNCERGMKEPNMDSITELTFPWQNGVPLPFKHT